MEPNGLLTLNLRLNLQLEPVDSVDRAAFPEQQVAFPVVGDVDSLVGQVAFLEHRVDFLATVVDRKHKDGISYTGATFGQTLS